MLGMFGLTGEKVFQDAGTLSGGEKTKLALAQLVSRSPQPAPARRADQQPRSALARGHCADALVELAGRHDHREPRQRFRARASSPTAVLLMPDGDLDYWSDDLLELVALA